MATHSGILAGKIPWTEEPGGLQSMGSQRVGHNLTTKQQQRHTRTCVHLCIGFLHKMAQRNLSERFGQPTMCIFVHCVHGHGCTRVHVLLSLRVHTCISVGSTV